MRGPAVLGGERGSRKGTHSTKPHLSTRVTVFMVFSEINILGITNFTAQL